MGTDVGMVRQASLGSSRSGLAWYVGAWHGSRGMARRVEARSGLAGRARWAGHGAAWLGSHGKGFGPAVGRRAE